MHRRHAFLCQPRVQRGENALADQAGVQHAAVEQDVRRTGQAARTAAHRAVLRVRRLLAQEARHVPRDRGIGRVGQADLLQADAPLLRRHIRARDRRQEAFAEYVLDVFAQQRGLDGAAHQARALAQNRDRLLFGFRARIEQLLFRHAAVGPQRLELAAVDARALLGQPVRHHAGQREIDVVAAQQDVLAHRDAVERQFAVALGHRDQREIGGAAADIDHQDQIADVDALAPIRMALDPRVEGRLRLFEQRDVRDNRPAARLRGSTRAPRRRTRRAP